MIGKKVENPHKTASKAARIGRLTDYIREPEKQNAQEKCIYSGARGFLTNDPRSQTAEMIALAQEAVRSDDPVNHYVFSWQDGEHPSPEQIEGAVSIILEVFGLEDHQVIYGLHADTDNQHLHIVVNRAHPDTTEAVKVAKINKGFDIEAVHKAVALIEHAQGWQREEKGRYQVLENGELCCGHYDKDKPRGPSQRRRDMENRTGEKSAERIAKEIAGPIIKNAQSWQELHRDLAAVGMRYEKTGSGAYIFVGDIAVKASSAGRSSSSLPGLQKRIGIYERPQEHPNVYITHTPEPHIGNAGDLSENRLHNLSERRLAHHGSEKVEGILSLDALAHRREPRGVRRERGTTTGLDPQPIKPNVPEWREYITGRRAHYAEKIAAKVSLDRQHEAERLRLAEQQKAHRDDVMGGSNWRGKGALLNVMRSVVAAEQAAEKAALKEKHRKEREQHRMKFRPYPDLEDWLRMRRSQSSRSG